MILSGNLVRYIVEWGYCVCRSHNTQILLLTCFCFVYVSTQKPCSLCLSGPKVMRWGCLTLITVVTGAASPWSRPHPWTPAEMPTPSPELLSNPSLSPLILWDRVSTEHPNTQTHTHTHTKGIPTQKCNCRGTAGEISSVDICHFSAKKECAVV